MILPSSEVPVYLYAEFVDMRKSINGLSALVEQNLEQSPFSQTVFVFCNRKRDNVKLLYWERNGFVLWYKRLLDGYDIRPLKPFPTLEYTTSL